MSIRQNIAAVTVRVAQPLLTTPQESQAGAPYIVLP